MKNLIMTTMLIISTINIMACGKENANPQNCAPYGAQDVNGNAITLINGMQCIQKTKSPIYSDGFDITVCNDPLIQRQNVLFIPSQGSNAKLPDGTNFPNFVAAGPGYFNDVRPNYTWCWYDIENGQFNLQAKDPVFQGGSK